MKYLGIGALKTIDEQLKCLYESKYLINKNVCLSQDI
jgi:hypothetical protein